MPSTKKVRNWKEYNKNLKKRGAIIFSFDENYLSELYYNGKQLRGGVRKYTEAMYIYLLTIKITLRLPWRATIGFAEGLLKKAFSNAEISVPDYAHVSREIAKLELSIKQYVAHNVYGMELAFDSTGVNVYSTSGWHQRKHGKNSLYHKREQWKKIHIAMDLDTMQIVSVEYSDSNVNDCEVVKNMCDKIAGKVKSVRADGAYDTQEFYQLIHKWGAEAMIPPARTSRTQDELKNKPKHKKDYLEQRDRVIGKIRESEDFDVGLKNWKIESGYHRRSLIEACMHRLKRTFGFSLQQKTEQGRRNEIITKINILNLMAGFGRAEYSS